jgi:hypothetical protein
VLIEDPKAPEAPYVGFYVFWYKIRSNFSMGNLHQERFRHGEFTSGAISPYRNYIRSHVILRVVALLPPSDRQMGFFGAFHQEPFVP